MKLIRYFLLVVLVFFLKVQGYDQKNFTWKCDKKDKCDLSVDFKNSKKIVFKGWDKSDIGNIAYNFLPNGLERISYSCGSPCSYTTYVDFKKQEISKPYFLVMATDSKRELIALPDPSDDNDQTLRVIPIFDNDAQGVKIKRNFSSGVSISLEKAKFLGNNLNIEYQAGKQYAEKKESIPIIMH